jgi:hypothetical protein
MAYRRIEELPLSKSNIAQIPKGGRRHRDSDRGQQSHSQHKCSDFSEEEDSSSDESQEGVVEDDEITEYSRVRLVARDMAKWNPDKCHYNLMVSSDGLGVQRLWDWGISMPKALGAVLATKPFRHKKQRRQLSDNDEFSYFEIEILRGDEQK